MIRRRLPITPVPSVPEIRLHLADERSGLGRRLAREHGAGPPYWAHAWGGGLALARYLLDKPEVVAGRCVLDLGCGSGLVAIAAALSGAREVTAVDVDPNAIAATRLNAALNGVMLDVCGVDLLDGLPLAVEIILVGDLFYEAGLAGRVCAFLDRCVEAGSAVLVGDPGRSPLPRARLEALQEVRVPDFGVPHHPVSSVVYAYRRPN